MQKIVFLVPYYGEFPEYFREWCYSASFLKDQLIDFFLFTDIPILFELPENIYLKQMSFEKFRAKIQSKFNFEICLPTPYNLCDFKPAFGYIFSEDIQNYDFWGNCDIDQVWGDIRHFITDDILRCYDRINFLGHMILYRNCDQINEAFMLLGAIYDYKTVFSSPIHYSFCEHAGMMKIFVDNQLRNYICSDYADLSPRHSRTWISRFNNYKYQILLWDQGHVYRKYITDEGSIGVDEYMYFHFQQKHPKSLITWNQGAPKAFIYHSDKFEIVEDSSQIDCEYIRDNCDFVSAENDRKEEMQYYYNKMKKFLNSPLKNKILWIRQRIATRYVIKHKEYFGKKYSSI